MILTMKSKIYLISLYLYSFFCTLTIKAQPAYTSNVLVVKEHILSASKFLDASRYDTAISLCNNALALAQRINYKTGQAEIYDLLAEVMLKNGRLDLSTLNNTQALALATDLRDTSLLINIKNRTGLHFLERGNSKEAEQNFTAALNLGGKRLTQLKKAEINSNLGSVRLALGEKEKSLEYFFTALKLYESTTNAKGMGETYSNIASLYYLSGKLDDAIEYQKKSIFVRQSVADKSGLVITNNNISQLYILKGDYDLALKHIKESIGLAEEIKNPKLQAASYAGMSVYNIRLKNFSEALIWQTKAIKLFEQIDDKQMLSRLYISAGNLANMGKDSTQAVTYLNKGLGLSESLYNKENIGNAYEKLSAFYLSHKDYEKAYNNYKKFISYKDSITDKSNLSKIEELKTQYDTEKKDNEILKLNTLQKLKQLQIEKQNAELNGNLIEAEKKQREIELLSKEKELQDLKIYKQSDELEKQTLIAKNKEQQLQINQANQIAKDKLVQEEAKQKNLWIAALLGGMLLAMLLGFLFINRLKLKKKLEQQSALLKIRNTISQDLHDEIGSTLTSINILSQVSEQILKEEPSKASEMMHTITTQSKAIQQSMSDIVWSLRNENEKLGSLASRMREYAAQTLEPLNIGLQINVTKILEEEKLPIEYRKEFLLVFKEAINNIAKHANATNVKVSLHKTSRQIELAIVDDGKWKGNSTGTGTKSMQQRASSLGGKLEIIGNENGTTVTLIVPIP